jgi:hypothetical protein
MDKVSLPIVEVKHTKLFKWGICLWILGILMIIYLLSFNIKNEIFRGFIAILSMIFLIIVPIFIGIRRTIIKEYLEIGQLILDSSIMTVIINEQKDEYKLSDLKNIKLNYTNVAGIPIDRGVGLTEGINNYFEFDFQDSHYKYWILIKNYTWLRILNDFIHNNQLNIDLYKSDKKVSRLIIY